MLREPDTYCRQKIQLEEAERRTEERRSVGVPRWLIISYAVLCLNEKPGAGFQQQGDRTGTASNPESGVGLRHTGACSLREWVWCGASTPLRLPSARPLVRRRQARTPARGPPL